MLKLHLSPALRRAIEAQGRQAYPNECCGALLGHDQTAQDGTRLRTVLHLHPLTNSFEPGEQYHRFRLDPLEYIAVEKAAAATGQLVLGFYHSHPDCPATPSEYDRSHAWVFYSYVIVSILKGTPAEMTSWVLDESTEQFLPETIL